MTFAEIKKQHEAANMIAGCYAKDDLYETLGESLVREDALIQLLDQCIPFVIRVRNAYKNIGLDVTNEEALLQSMTETKPI